MVGYFYWGFKEDGFQAGSKWLASANLSPKELDHFCGELTKSYNGDEHAQWIEWIGENFPPGKGDGPIMDLMGLWTSDDYEAAGKWLASTPEGQVKNAAIRSFARACGRSGSAGWGAELFARMERGRAPRRMEQSCHPPRLEQSLQHSRRQQSVQHSSYTLQISTPCRRLASGSLPNGMNSWPTWPV